MKKLRKPKNVVKKTFLHVAAMTVVLSFTSACNEDPDPNLPSPPNSASYADLKKLADELVNVARFPAEEGINYTSPKGSSVTLAPNSLVDHDGQEVHGEVELTFVEIYDRGTMVASDKALVGYIKIADIAGESHREAIPLVTGGQFFVQVKQGGKILKPKPGHPYNVVVDAKHTGGVNSDMTIWSGIFVNMAGDPIPDIDITVNQCCPPSNKVIWEPGDGEHTWMSDAMGTSTYNIYSTGGFGWTNIGRPYSITRDMAPLKVFVPEVYNPENSAVYLAYEGEPGVLAQLNVYNPKEHYFSAHYPVPLDLKVHVIFTSESDGNIIYAITKPLFQNNSSGSQKVIFESSAMRPTTAENLKALVNALK